MQHDPENCSGCTDRNSEGTHQGHTIQHPCKEGGDPNCGYCFPEIMTHHKDNWEEEFDALPTFIKRRNGRTLLGDPTYREDVYVLVDKDFILETRTAAHDEGRKAAIEYIRQNVVAIDRQPLENKTLEFDLKKFTNLLEAALYK